jgi:septal ring factor EnvC (AmiA/AmiB activator)
MIGKLIELFQAHFGATATFIVVLWAGSLVLCSWGTARYVENATVMQLNASEIEQQNAEDEIRSKLSGCHTSLNDHEDKNGALQAEIRNLTAKLEQDKSNLTEMGSNMALWQNAVKERDELIEGLNQSLKQSNTNMAVQNEIDSRFKKMEEIQLERKRGFFGQAAVRELTKDENNYISLLQSQIFGYQQQLQLCDSKLAM